MVEPRRDWCANRTGATEKLAQQRVGVALQVFCVKWQDTLQHGGFRLWEWYLLDGTLCGATYPTTHRTEGLDNVLPVRRLCKECARSTLREPLLHDLHGEVSSPIRLATTRATDRTRTWPRLSIKSAGWMPYSPRIRANKVGARSLTDNGGRCRIMVVSDASLTRSCTVSPLPQPNEMMLRSYGHAMRVGDITHHSLQHGTHLLTPSMMSEYSSSGMRCQVTGLPRRELLVVSAPASREDAVLRPGEWATKPDSERRCNARSTHECQMTTRCGADTLSRQWWYLWVASLPL